MQKLITPLRLFIGTSMLAFGVLKFVNPFKLWYTTQINASALPLQEFSYWSGQLGEVFCGIIYIFLALFSKRISQKTFQFLFTSNTIAIVLIMLVAVYVHLHPAVSNEVLPLKIKTPYIPIFFLGVTFLSFWLEKRKAIHGK